MPANRTTSLPNVTRAAGNILVRLLVLPLAAGPVAWGQLPPPQSARRLKPAAGFTASLWAWEPMVRNPTGMDIDSRGRVWIAEGLNYRLYDNKQRGTDFKRLPGADRIKILQDSDGDGTADKVIVFADGIYPMPLGLAVQERWQGGQYRGARVFVGFSTDLLVLEDTDGDDRADRRYTLLSGFRGYDTEHGLHGMALGPDGRLYFTQGDARYGTDKVQGGETTFDVVDRSGRHLRCDQYGTTLRVGLDGRGLEVLSWRHRNNYEVCVDSFGHPFVSDNDDDGDLGCRMVWIMPGGNYGYRHPDSNRQWAEEVPGVVPKLVGTGNGGPAGIMVYEGTLFPKPYWGSVLQVDPGTHQVNFHPLRRYGAAFRSDYRVLLSSDDSWFRPVDAATAPDGSVYVCDWYDAGVGAGRLSDQSTGRIYRLAPSGAPPAGRPPRPNFATVGGLIAGLKSPNVATHFAARQGLLAAARQSPRQVRSALLELFRTGLPHQRARALWVLADLPGTGSADVRSALHDEDPAMRELAVRILAADSSRHWVVEPESARHAAPRALPVLADLLPLAEDPDAGVRRELLLALRHVQTPLIAQALERLTLAWDGKDRYYLEALRLALRQREPEFIAGLFDRAARLAVQAGWADGPVALPPYFPITTNASFLHAADRLGPSNAASRLAGLAWVLERPEALPALRAVLQRNDSPWVARAAYAALARIDDWRAAELLADRFLAQDEVREQRRILRQLAARLGSAWQHMRQSPKMSRLFASALASRELRVEAIRAIARCQAAGYETALMKLAGDQRQELATRAAAIEALGRLHYRPARQLAGRLVQRAKGQALGGPLAQAALAAVIQFGASDAHQLLATVIGDATYPLDFRRRAVQLLAGTSDGSRRLLALYSRKQLPADLLTEAAFVLHNHPDRDIRRLARRQIPLPKTASGKRIEDLKKVLALPGDPRRGREVFYRDGASACARCHRVHGIGSWVGPDLSSIGTKYGKSELLYHILNPNGAINYNYVSYAVALTDGRVLTGLITDQDSEQIVLKTATGERLSIPADEIEAQRPQTASIMPDNLVETLTEQDLADLVAYLSTLRQPATLVTEYYVFGPVPAGTYDARPPPKPGHDSNGSSGSEPKWRPAAAGRDGLLDLSDLLPAGRRAELFCYVSVVSDRAQQASVVIRTANPLTLWHDGQPVKLSAVGRSSQETTWRGSLQLPSGQNHLLLRLGTASQPAGLVTTIIAQAPIRQQSRPP